MHDLVCARRRIIGKGSGGLRRVHPRGTACEKQSQTQAQESTPAPTPALAPEVQEALAEYQKVSASLDPLLRLTEQAWQYWARWQVRKPQVMLPPWS